MDWPAKATFITPEERELVFARLAADSDAVADESVSWANVLSAMKDYKVWLYGACFHTLSLPLYTLSMFMVCCQHSRRSYIHADRFPKPSIIKDLGYSAAEAQLLTIPPYVRLSLISNPPVFQAPNN